MKIPKIILKIYFPELFSKTLSKQALNIPNHFHMEARSPFNFKKVYKDLIENFPPFKYFQAKISTPFLNIECF